MIYNPKYNAYQWTEFAFDVDDKFYSYFPDGIADGGSAEGWLRHQQRRIYLRLYVFVDSVLTRHNAGKLGFKDPIIVWSNIKTGQFSIHPGKNRIVLKMLLPEVRMVGWVMDNSAITSRKAYNNIFNNIQPLVRDKEGNRQIKWQTQHRTVGGEDQYHMALLNDTYLGNHEHDTPKRRQKWDELCKTRGFGCYVHDHFFYNIGNPQANYSFDNVAGIYQVFLHHFFDYPFSKWERHYFQEII